MYYDVLFHVDTDEASFTTALRNAENYVNAGIDGEYTIAIVVNGKAIELLRRDTCPQRELLAKLCRGRVRLFACNNALKEHAVAPGDIVDEAVVVPAGIVHVVTLQREGYAYVKP